MLTLLSPAKTLDFSFSPEGLPATLPRFAGDAELLMKRCKRLSVASLRQLMKISQPLAELNRKRFQQMRLPFTPDNSRPCLLAFQGGVYKGLDAASLSPADLIWAQDRVRILSGLYGLLRPFDLIQPYRLEMGTRLDNPRGKNLYEFWGERLAEALNQEHAERPVKAVLNLASNEYAKAVPAALLQPPMITAAFQEIRDGAPRTIGLSAKRARGLMARFQVRNRITDPRELQQFDEEGYAFRSDLSDARRLVFTREQA